MPPVIYNKPFRDYANLVAHLSGKGLSIHSVQEAEQMLKKVNYYRFKIYLRPFLDLRTNRFVAPADFRDGLNLYYFDRELRELLFSIVSRLEIKLRSRLDQVVTEHTGNAFWYLDNTLFHRQQTATVVQNEIDVSFQRSTDDFVNHFKTKYVNNINATYPHLPPFWIAAELTTFGNVRALYEALDKSRFSTSPRTNKLDSLAQEFGAANLRDLNGWLTALRDIRNRCAHHSRLWNCNYREPPAIRQILDHQLQPSHPNRIYLILAVVQIMSTKIGIDLNAGIKDSVLRLFANYPVAGNFLRSMGFPNNWETDPLWG